ncbi:hypothetical protein J8273_8449 [Carpediemonas membranifera]|uniref:Uncharacterized protein n=1 Tax=Carpediemonas membranifera TaxID=201153 RepID=A0A8J6B4D0_9EUKA|nr:hypothetical protein J8273_8449 [Carpediemonas membranifera]|eukprot:KAG9389772.1 hypothetical protein J8273_8449 [Carpediemonas membranifera]
MSTLSEIEVPVVDDVASTHVKEDLVTVIESSAPTKSVDYLMGQIDALRQQLSSSVVSTTPAVPLSSLKRPRFGQELSSLSQDHWRAFLAAYERHVLQYPTAESILSNLGKWCHHFALDTRFAPLVQLHAAWSLRAAVPPTTIASLAAELAVCQEDLATVKKTVAAAFAVEDPTLLLRQLGQKGTALWTDRRCPHELATQVAWCDKRLQDMYASFGLKESSDPSQVEQLVDTGGNPLAIVTMEGTMGPNKWTNLGKSLTECCGMIMQGSTLIRVTNHGNRLDQHAHGMPASDKRSVDSFVERTRVSVRRERAAKRPNVTRIRQKLMIIRHYNLRSFTLVKEIKETRTEMRKEKKANFWDSEWNISVEDDEEV